MNNIIWFAVELAVAIAFFILGKYVFPAIPVDKLQLITAWAERFVIWARDFFEESEGEIKMKMVVEQLGIIAKEYGLEFTEDQLVAIAQTAYDAMKQGMAAHDPD